jgi:hypothetical protein
LSSASPLNRSKEDIERWEKIKKEKQEEKENKKRARNNSMVNKRNRNSFEKNNIVGNGTLKWDVEKLKGNKSQKNIEENNKEIPVETVEPITIPDNGKRFTVKAVQWVMEKFQNQDTPTRKIIDLGKGLTWQEAKKMKKENKNSWII